MFERLKFSRNFSNLKKAYYSNNFMEAIEYANKILSLDSNHLEVLKYKYNSLVNIEDFDNALLCADRIISLEKSCIAYLNKGTTLCYLNRVDEGFKILDGIIDNCDEYELAFINKCGFLCTLQEFDEILRLSDKILKKNPVCSNAYDLKALAYFEKQEYELSLINVEKALELDNANEIAKNRKEVILSKLNSKQ